MLQIRKKLENVFKHIDTLRGDFMLSQGYFKLDNGQFQIVEEGGAERYTYSLSEITIYDDTSGGIAENYATDVALYARLVELRYNLLDLNGLAPATPVSNITESPLDLVFSGSNSFTFPENYILLSVFTNIALQKYAKYQRTSTGIIVLDDLEIGDVINVRGFVTSGVFSPDSGCLTARCIEAMPTFDNDLEAAGLPEYTPYKTSTGQLRYKLPSTDPTGYWDDDEIWVDSETWED